MRIGQYTKGGTNEILAAYRRRKFRIASVYSLIFGHFGRAGAARRQMRISRGEPNWRQLGPARRDAAAWPARSRLTPRAS